MTMMEVEMTMVEVEMTMMEVEDEEGKREVQHGT